MYYITASNNSLIKSELDEKDYLLYSIYNWYYDASNGYLARTYNYKKVYLHRLICNFPKKKAIDHVDGNKLNNTRANLRICDNKDNVKSRNSINKNKKSSQYKGVYFHKKNKNWYSKIMYENKQYHLGCFTEEIEAAKCYDLSAKKYFKEFANLNFPEDN